METLQPLLIELLKNHGLQTSVSNEWVLIDGQLPGITADFSEIRQFKNGYSVRIDVTAKFKNGRMIVESFGDMATDVNQAKVNAFQSFCQNSFHVFLAALWNQEPDAHTSTEIWQIDNGSWRATIGGFGVKAYSGGIPIRIPEGLFPVIEESIKKLHPEEDMLWVRTYYCNIGSQLPVSEVLLNNQPWPELSSLITKLDWDVTDYFYSVRNFIILQKL